MADPKLTTDLEIALGDGADPEVFSFLCGANTRSIKLSNNTGEDVILDCDDPDSVVAAIVRWTESQDTEMTIAGRCAVGSGPMLRAWVDSGAAKNAQIRFLNSAALGGGYYTVPTILQGLELGKEGTATVTFSATLVGAGRRVWTDAA